MWKMLGNFLKGGIDDGESSKEALFRELEEEIVLEILKL